MSYREEEHTMMEFFICLACMAAGYAVRYIQTLEPER